MLEMVRIDGVDYYDQLAKSEYYAKGNAQGEPPGTWGAGVEKIGLKAGEQVDGMALRLVMTGHTATGEAMTQNAGKEGARVGMDFTFSAPKSVSVLWANADPQLRAEISQIQATAVAEAMAYMGTKAETRRDKAGAKSETPEALIFATFEHCESRAKDPQLHTHTVVSNACVRHDGTTGAIDQEPFYLHKLAAGATYRASLAQQLRAKGFKLENDSKIEGVFRVVGMPNELEKHFSKRSEQIREAVKETGNTSAQARRVISKETRDKKGNTNRADLFNRWQQESQERGFDAQSMEYLKQEKAPAFTLPTHAELAEKLTEKEAFFEARHVDQALAEFGQFVDFDREAFKADFLKSAELLPRVATIHNGHGRQAVAGFTSAALEKMEAQAIQSAQARQSETAHQLDPTKVAQVVADFEKAQGFTLFADQRQAVEHITSQSGGLTLVRGLAGTGKTTALRPTVDAFKASGFEVVGATTSSKAAQVLSKETGLKALTIAQALIDLDREALTLGPRSVLILDEAGMVGSRDFSRLQEHADKAGAKIVLIGDERQLQSVAAGGIFWALQQHGHIKTADLTTITRQQDADERKASLLFYQGKADEALKIYEQKGAVKTHAHRPTVVEMLAQDYAADPASTQQKIAIAATNADAYTLNESIRQRLKDAGQIGKEGTTLENMDGQAVELAKGDRVLFKQNSKIFKVRNNETATVLDTKKTPNGHRLIVEMDNGQRRQIDTNEYKHIRHAYAQTTHSTQGETTAKAFYLYSRGADLSQGYVGMTRHKQAAQIYGTQADREGMAQGMAVAHIKKTTLDLKAPEIAPTLGQEVAQVNASSLAASSVGRGQQSVGGQMPQIAPQAAIQTAPKPQQAGQAGQAQNSASVAAQAIQMGVNIGQKALAEAHASQAVSQAQQAKHNEQAHAWAQQQTKNKGQEMEL